MKKTLFFAILFFISGYFLSAQAPCINDIEYTLLSMKQIPKAKKMMDDCFPGNESSAKAWLVRANVYIQYYTYELDRKNKDPKYVITAPDAVLTANESFYKALETNKDVRASSGLLEAKEGQLLSAPPIHDMAAQAITKENYAEAIKLLNIVIRSYRAELKANAQYLVYAYLDLARCYQAMGDDANYKKILLDAAKLNTPDPVIYINLYEIYKQEKDTVKCGEILNQARKVVSESMEFKVYELGYYEMIGDSAKLIDAALKMYEQNKTDFEIINMVAGYLVNNRLYKQAEEIIKEGLAIYPNSFELNSQMAFRFYFEAVDYDRKKEDLLALKKYMAATPLLEKANEILETAVIWAEKAYKINQDDREHNIMYSGILVRLMMDAPEGLQEKVNSYIIEQ